MNARAKSAIILLATLVVGIVLGALVASRVINHRLDELRRMRSRGGFSQALENVVQPSSDLQREQIHVILGRSHTRMDSINAEWRSRIRASSDSLRSELEDVLDAEQYERMTKWFEDSRSRRNRDASRRDRNQK
ncbi:MAG: hypothetical protein KDD65_02800 [Bacteroidetes bacterium]|nr:hypothetical protein [Bacteroidota bacterium]